MEQVVFMILAVLIVAVMAVVAAVGFVCFRSHLHRPYRMQARVNASCCGSALNAEVNSRRGLCGFMTWVRDMWSSSADVSSSLSHGKAVRAETRADVPMRICSRRRDKVGHRGE